MTITADQLVSREVFHCVSSLVATLASGWNVDHVNEDMDALPEQAQELCAPVDDWEEAAKGAGFGEGGYADGPNGESKHGWIDINGDVHPDAETACFVNDVEPYQWEVFEHWIISEWLADELIKHGEKVDKDFAGLCVWGRTTTGQAISQDAVIQKIHAELVAGK